MTGDTLTLEPASGGAPTLPRPQWESAPAWHGPRWEVALRAVGAVLVLAWLGWFLWGVANAPRYVSDQLAFLRDAHAGRLVTLDGSGYHEDQHLPERARLDAERLGRGGNVNVMRWQNEDGYYVSIRPSHFDAASAVREPPYVLAHPGSVRFAWISAGDGARDAGFVVIGIAILAAIALDGGPRSRVMPKWAWGLSFVTVVGLAAWLVFGGSTQRGRPAPVRYRATWPWVVGAGMVLALFVHTTGGGPLRSVLNPPHPGGGTYTDVPGVTSPP